MTNLTNAKAVVAKWETALTSAQIYFAKADLAGFKREHEKRVADVKFAQEAGEKAAKDLAAARKAQVAAEEKVRTLDAEVKKVAKASPALTPAPAKVEKKSPPKEKAQKTAAAPTNAPPVVKASAPKAATAAATPATTNAPVASAMAPKAPSPGTNVVVVVETPLDKAQKTLAKAKADAAELEKRVASLTKQVKTTLPARLAAAKSAVEKSTRELEANQARVDRLTATPAPKTPPANGTKAAKL